MQAFFRRSCVRISPPRLFCAHRRAESKRRVSRRTKRGFACASALLAALVAYNIIDDMYHPEKRLSVLFSILRSFPLRTYSKIQGAVCNIWLPRPFNLLVVGAARLALGISLENAQRSRLSEYHSINDLFTRKLALGSRPIGSCVVSPVDGTVIYASKIRDSKLCKIKGVQYREEELLCVANIENMKLKGGDIYEVVIYLSPSNYHRFHSFLDFDLREIKHVPSYLFSVGARHMKYLEGLLSKNERVVFSGETPWGYGALVAVGSAGVGSILTPFEKISTNSYFIKTEIRDYKMSEKVGKGEELGYFCMGSTVAVFFEAPEGFSLTCRENSSVRMGEPLGAVA